MTQDAKRRPGQDPPRHAVGITRTCLASGSMQLPFALAGELPQGELLVHDTESGEALILWSEPPRRLAGLGPFFERHDLQVNDSVVLEVDGDEIRLTATKRPRRSRPVVQPSTWNSLKDEPAKPSASRPHPDVPRAREEAGDAAGHDRDGHDPNGHDPNGHDPDGHDAPQDEPARRNEAGRDEAGRDEAGRDEAGRHEAGRHEVQPNPPEPAQAARREDEPASPRQQASFDAFEMPRAPAVVVRPADETTTRSDRPLSRSETMPSGGGAFAGLRRVARSWFGGGGASDRDPANGSGADAPDWTRGWDAEEDDVVPTPAFSSSRSQASRRSTVEPEPADPADTPEDVDEAVGSDRTEERGLPEAPFATEPPEIDDEEDAIAPTPLFPEASPPRGPVRRPVDETPSGVPARAERFLGGDLRTRLLRYLASPEMGSIAHTERIAKRFDLDEETAAGLLSDIADDPPDGLRLREVRNGAWRIERTLGR